MVSARLAPVPQGHPFRSGPIPPAPPHPGNCEQEPEIIVPNRNNQFARSSDRPSLGSIPPRALLDEATTIAIQQQRIRRDRLLWTLAGTLVAMVLLWTQLKSRTAGSTAASEVTLLPAMASAASGPSGPGSLRPAEIPAPNTSKQLAAEEEAPPIDLDEDEQPARSTQSHMHTTPRAVPPEPQTNPANGPMSTAGGRDSNSQRDERAAHRATSTAPATVPNSAPESPRRPPMRRAWFPED